MENMKKLFQGKKGKFFIAAIAIVAILGFFAWRRKSAAAVTPVVADAVPNPTTDTTASTTGSAGSPATPDINRADVVGMFADYNTVVQDAISKQTDQNKALAEAFNTSLAYQQSGFNQTFAGIQSGLGDLTAKVNAGLLSNATDKLASATQTPTYSDTVTGHGGTNPTLPAVVVPSNVVPFAPLGNGGVDYNTASAVEKQKIQDNEARLKTDTSFVASERARTDQVIKNREAAGLDTSAQEAYKKKLG